MNRTRHAAGDELAPGYQLTDYLGRGGFGEVWTATGPGGIQLAMKVIHDLDRKKGGKELRALRLLKNIRHPNLVPLTGFWLRTDDGEVFSDESDFLFDSQVGDERADGELARGTLMPERRAAATLATAMEDVQLIIAMGLCERSLFDRLRDCQDAGLTGVPLDELLTYMEDAARAIDLLNTKHEIQHCDIKPQNILLLSGAAQVADFGLAKVIGDVRESSMGAGTIAYGAPEVLLGKGPSHSTDQYSLAISYFELRTGELPFGGERISDVLNAKQHGTIDLSMLAPGEQQVIAKAAAIDPDDRFAGCIEMVRALRQCPQTLTVHDDGEGTSTRETRRMHDATTVPLPGRKRAPAALIAAGLIAGLAGLLVVIGGWFIASRSAPVDDHSTTTGNSTAPGRTAGRDKPVDGDDGTASRVEIAGTPASHDTAERAATVAEDTAEVLSASDRVATAVDGLADVSRENSRAIAESARQNSDTARQIASAVEANLETSRVIAESSAATAENTRQMVEVAKQMNLSLDAIREELARVADSGGLIRVPSSPSDFYHNARMYEQRGDYLNARRNYAHLIGFGLEALDPHLQYQRVIRIQDGRLAAREVYADLSLDADNLAATFARLIVEPDTTRAANLERFISDHARYAPAFYYLSNEYSKERLGTQGLADMRREKHLLDQFQMLVDEGQLLGHFLDQSHAMSMIDDARSRLAALRQFDASVFEAPVRMTTMMSNTSWSVNLAISEVAREISYRLSENGPFQSTGFGSYVDQRTGAPSPRPTFPLPLLAERTTLWVKYVDIRGNEQGPYELVFDPAAERVRNGKLILEQLPHAWISYRDYQGRLLVYFSHLVGYRYAISEIRYSIDSDALDKRFPLTPVDLSNPHAVKSDVPIHIVVPNSTRFITVELAYRDGTTSPRQTFQYKPSADGANAGNGNPASGPPPGNQNASDQPARTGPKVDVHIDSLRRRPRLGIGF